MRRGHRSGCFPELRFGSTLRTHPATRGDQLNKTREDHVMLSIDVGKVSRHPAPAGPVGDESFPPAAQQPPGLIPGTLATYPGGTRRPRNLPEYQAACRAALGEPVAEYDACRIVEGMRIYQGGRFLTVVAIQRSPSGDVELTMHGHGLVAVRLASMATPVYVLAPASDACHAPDAGTAGGESTAVTPCR